MLALLDPFSGIAGDMFIGALLDLGLDARFIEHLPAALGLENVGVRIERVKRSGIAAMKVDFDIPPQPHGRHLKHLVEIVQRSDAPPRVKDRAAQAFTLIASVEAAVHATTVEKVHLHEVGAVDAILDVVGTLWGLEKLGVTEVRCGVIAVGDGFVDCAHGRMPVPAPATMKILEGLRVSPGPGGSGELTTPTGASLVRVLSAGPVPPSYVPRAVGYGAGTKEFPDRPNVFRVILADASIDTDREAIVVLTADIDDMSPERLAEAAEGLRRDGAFDVLTLSAAMKKGRLGTRLEVLARPGDADRLEGEILMKTSSIGVRKAEIFRRVLPRSERVVEVRGQCVRVKVVKLPDGSFRSKPESDDVHSVSSITGLPVAVIATEIEAALQGEERV